MSEGRLLRRFVFEATRRRMDLGRAFDALRPADTGIPACTGEVLMKHAAETMHRVCDETMIIAQMQEAERAIKVARRLLEEPPAAEMQAEAGA